MGPWLKWSWCRPTYPKWVSSTYCCSGWKDRPEFRRLRCKHLHNLVQIKHGSHHEIHDHIWGVSIKQFKGTAKFSHFRINLNIRVMISRSDKDCWLFESFRGRFLVPETTHSRFVKVTSTHSILQNSISDRQSIKYKSLTNFAPKPI